MVPSPFTLYSKIVLDKPIWTLLAVTALVVLFGCHAPDFKLDASADSLVLENDRGLNYYRSIRARYGTDDSLIVTYTPKGQLFSERILADLGVLRQELAAIERVDSVISILNVPLIESSPVSIANLRDNIPTLVSPEIDKAAAQKELLSSPLYRNLIISPDGKTTALQVNFRFDEKFYALLRERNTLREKRLSIALSPDERGQLEKLSKQFREYSDGQLEQQNKDIAQVRAVMETHRHSAELYLGGVPMIAADSIDFIRHDLIVFGVGVLCFLILILTVAFRKPRWVILPMLTCLSAGICMVGFLGFMDWRVTVVSSNFISLLLIITLSLTVHLIVRYRELHTANPWRDQRYLVEATIRTKVLPCFYTAITTIVAFGSLIVCDIRPVIDFGWMMAIGISMAFVLAFTLLPAGLMLLSPTSIAKRRNITGAITQYFANLIQRHGNLTLTAFVIAAIISVIGISLLTVENRFIDYYRESTEIFQGMQLIDQRLGGTTPLDVVIDAPSEFFAENGDEIQDELYEDDLESEYEDSGGITSASYWFNTHMLDEIAEIHEYLDSLSETGKVLSIDTTIKILETLQKDEPIDDFFLSILYKRLPEEIKNALFAPYLSDDGNQIRFSIRVFESDVSLRRNELLEKIQHQLVNDLGLSEGQVHLTGMVVLYNNLLQSLFRSQILTIGAVFLAILMMFLILFRSAKLAAIAIIPNLIAAAMVLGFMGLVGIPLDIMTITVAAISIGIAVDDTIHYVYRFRTEFEKDQDYRLAIRRCHSSIGHAMYYTTVTITLGFSILALSNFVPTIYFGLLTGFAMLVALLADLTLLPLLLVKLKSLG